MSPRSEEYLDSAEARLRAARVTLTVDPAATVAAAYYVVVNAARAALSERDLTSRTHSGLWQLFRQTFVLPGDFDEALYAAATTMQGMREAADYAAAKMSPDQTRDAVERAEAFLQATRAMIDPT